MDSCLIETTEDMEIVRQIMLIPEIWDRAAEDGISQQDFYPGFDSLSHWLLCKQDDKIIGIILLHHDNSTTLKLHPYLRREHYSLGREMMKSFYKWFIENTSIHKLIVSMPENQKKVYNFAKKVGFKDEGFNRESYLKNGEIYGQYNLGITRKEVEQWVQ